MSKTLVAVQHHLVRRRALRVKRSRGERGAATAEYAIATVAACGFGGILITLLKSDAMQSLLKAIINAALRAAGIDFQL